MYLGILRSQLPSMWKTWKHIPSQILARAYANTAMRVAGEKRLAQMKSIGERLSLTEKEGERMGKLLMRSPPKFVDPEVNLDMMASLGMSTAQQKKLVLSSSSMFSVRGDVLMRKWTWFAKNIGFSNEEMVKLVSRHPTIFSRSIENKIDPIVSELKSLGLNELEIKSIVMEASQILSISLEERFKPRIACLKNLELGDDELREFIKKWPWILEKNIPKKIEWMRTALSLDTKHLRDLIVKHPKFLNINIDSVIESFDYLLKGGLTRWESFDVIVRQPTRAALKSGSLISKVEFAKKALKKDIRDVVNWSEYVSRPFLGHIGLRISFLAAEGCQYWDQPLSALFVFGDEGFFNLHKEKWQSLSMARFYEHKTWWNELSDETKENHMDLLSKPRSAPWKS